MTLKDVVKLRRKELEKIIRKAPKDERCSLMITCRTCLAIGLYDSEEDYKRYLQTTLISQKEICKAAYDLGIQFGPLEKEYAQEQLIDNWLTKAIFKPTRKKFLDLF